jgi:hypothetical protein
MGLGPHSLLMAVCTGASQAKAGVPASVVVDASYLQGLLPTALAWLYPYLPFMHGLEIGDVGAFCSVDPPTFSLPSTDDFLAFLVGGPFTQVQVVSNFLRDLTKAYLWYQLCECASGSPTPITPPAEPTDMPAINPAPYVSPPTATACQINDSGPQAQLGSLFFGLLPVGLPNATGWLPLPKGASTVQLKCQNIASGGNPKSIIFRMNVRDIAGTQTNIQSNTTQASGNTTTFSKNIPSSAIEFYVDATESVGSTTSNLAQATATFYCGSGPGQTVTPCCPPDPIAQGLLRQILDLVTLVQRQAVPFGYIASTAHTGLSGAGALSISGLLGVKVAVTTLPASYGSAGSSPTEHFDLGFLTFGTVDGFPSSYRIEHNPQVILPPRCSAFTDLDYDLAPGVVVTITELLREP